MASTTALSTLTNATEGTGTAVDFSSAKTHVSAILTVNGEVTDGMVHVQASHDNTSWVHLHTFSGITTGLNQKFEMAGAYRYFRASVISAITGGGSVTVTLMEADV